VISLASSRVVLPSGVKRAVVTIDSGRIAAVAERAPDGIPVTDLGDRVLMPGLVDAHVHVNEPGRTEWEGFTTATRAAAAGGITTIVDMPLNCIPVTTSAEALRIKLDACTPLLWADCAFWGGVIPGNAGDLGALVDAGARGAKCFLVHSGIDDFPHVSEADLRTAMQVLASKGVPLLVHAELESPVVADPAADPRAYGTFLASRPSSWEESAIALVIRLCRETRCRVHIVHLSAANALPLVAAAKAEGLPITAETCPHYLTFEAESVPDGATEYKCCPPIREHANRERLWGGLADGTLEFVVSDHSPCTPNLKLMDRGDFMAAWGGVASLQLGLSIIWTEARKRGFDVAWIAEHMSRRPAAFAGLSARKGAIAVGMDADLVAWDPDAGFEITRESLFHRHKVTPYLGRTVQGVVHGTWVRGERVWDGHAHVGGPVGRPILGAFGPQP
jgi:allantoinase